MAYRNCPKGWPHFAPMLLCVFLYIYITLLFSQKKSFNILLLHTKNSGIINFKEERKGENYREFN